MCHSLCSQGLGCVYPSMQWAGVCVSTCDRAGGVCLWVQGYLSLVLVGVHLRTHPWADSPSQTTPLGRHPPPWVDTPWTHALVDTLYWWPLKQAACILLECILVTPLDTHTPTGHTPPCRQPPSPVEMTIEVDGRHPTGLHSCYIIITSRASQSYYVTMSIGCFFQVRYRARWRGRQVHRWLDNQRRTGLQPVRAGPEQIQPREVDGCVSDCNYAFVLQTYSKQCGCGYLSNKHIFFYSQRVHLDEMPWIVRVQ